MRMQRIAGHRCTNRILDLEQRATNLPCRLSGHTKIRWKSGPSDWRSIPRATRFDVSARPVGIRIGLGVQCDAGRWPRDHIRSRSNLVRTNSRVTGSPGQPCSRPEDSSNHNARASLMCRVSGHQRNGPEKRTEHALMVVGEHWGFNPTGRLVRARRAGIA